ncbi:MAG: hypothetical protein U9O98_04425 [Asgard group archaeon]|nr:hypothetical protein [Asgard group archaeon]
MVDRKNKIIECSLIIILTFAVIYCNSTNNFLIHNVSGVNAEEAFEEIGRAYEKIQRASLEGLNVESLIADLNIAITLYENEEYDEAFAKAAIVYEEASDLVSEAQLKKVFPYIIIPVNIVLIAAIFLFFGRNVWNWYKNRRDKEFLELEIVYEEEEN